jgi:ribosomal protein S27AE
MLKICPRCGEEVPEEYSLCPYCGSGVRYAEYTDDYESNDDVDYETYTGYND